MPINFRKAYYIILSIEKKFFDVFRSVKFLFVKKKDNQFYNVGERNLEVYSLVAIPTNNVFFPG